MYFVLMAPTATGLPITLTERELHAYKYLFDLADTDHDGVIAGGDAVNFLKKSRLPLPVLKEVWESHVLWVFSDSKGVDFSR